MRTQPIFRLLILSLGFSLLPSAAFAESSHQKVYKYYQRHNHDLLSIDLVLLQEEDIPVNVRQAVMHRDKNKCIACETTTGLTLDHGRAIKNGGDNASGNLAVLCGTCQRYKAKLDDQLHEQLKARNVRFWKSGETHKERSQVDLSETKTPPDPKKQTPAPKTQEQISASEQERAVSEFFASYNKFGSEKFILMFEPNVTSTEIQKVQKRDGELCVICNSTAGLEITHCRALMNGGQNNYRNLVTLCKDCRRAKARYDENIHDELFRKGVKFGKF